MLLKTICNEIPLSRGKKKLESRNKDNFMPISGGEFTMGSPLSEVNRSWYETLHQVRVSDFFMGKYEVTVDEFKRFTAESGYQTDAEKFNDTENWRHGVLGSVRTQSEKNHPVLYVSWNDAVAYCKWLSAITEELYRLPTEAEWEYACRAGSNTPFNTGENLMINQGCYNGNVQFSDNPENTVQVNSFAPNGWGLYNMHGNVWEWCSDWYGGMYYDDCKTKGTVINPVGPVNGLYRVILGGSWLNIVGRCRSAYRSYETPDFRNLNIGFRLVCVP